MILFIISWYYFVDKSGTALITLIENKQYAQTSFCLHVMINV